MQKCWWAFIVFEHRLLRISQQRKVRSSLADTINLPPGWKTIPRTQLSWPFNTIRQTPTVISQIYRNENQRILLHWSFWGSFSAQNILLVCFCHESQTPRMVRDECRFYYPCQQPHLLPAKHFHLPKQYIQQCDRDLEAQPSDTSGSETYSWNFESQRFMRPIILGRN